MTLKMSTNIAKDSHTGIVIRESTRSDAERLRRLAQLDSARLYEGPMVVAEVDGELRAAATIDDGSVIADPFPPQTLSRSHRCGRRSCAPRARSRCGWWPRHPRSPSRSGTPPSRDALLS
jgi:hypothetical protein